MNQHLKSILNLIERNKSFSCGDKAAVLTSLKDADKELEITAFELDAQNRELEIESSLERVRAVAMGMNKADDLLNVCEILFHELQNLEFGELRNALINIHDDSKGSFLNYDFSDEMGKSITTVLYSAHPFIAKQLKQVRSARDAFSETILTGKELKEWIEARKRNGEKDDPRLENAESLYYYFYSIGTGAIGISTLNSIGKTKLDLLKRFRNVFSLSYQRYIDITKAEKQAREAQIEAALERVRARTMAMQKSDELADVATLLFRQVNDLGIKTWTTGFNIWSDDNNAYEDWIASPGGGFIEPYVIDATAFSEFKALSDAKKSGTEFFIRDQKGEILQETYKQLSRFATKNQFEKILEEGFEFPSRQFVHMVFGPKVSLMFITYEPVPEAHDIFKRFGKVFEQTYTRFLDLQKAEAQAREAQIEAALEKVRSASMAMHLSHELKQVINVVTEQFQHLGFKLDTANFITNYSESGGDWWISTPGVSTPTHVYIPSTDIPFFNNLATSMRKGIGFFTEFFSSEEKNEFFNYVFENTSLKIISDKRKRYIYQASGIASSSVLSKNVILSIANYQLVPYSDEENAIIKRIAIVFEQSYTRFLDLQKAEAQAKEAQIEAALERVRGKAMSMHTSRDLADTIGVFYHEIELLSITPRRCGVGLMNKETHDVELSTMNTTEQGESIEIIGKLILTGHPVLEGIYDNWILQKEYHPVLRGNEIKKYYQLIRPQIGYPDYPTDTAQYGYFFFFNEGGVYAWTEKELSEDELKIYRRFTSVLSLTYKRYKDLKDTEANAREAIKRASLDRVRAEIASMRTTGDLERITPLIWNELTTLGVPFIRCGVFIMDEQNEQIHSFLSTPDGKAIAAFKLPYNDAGELSKVLAHWHKKEVYKDHWDEAAFAKWSRSLAERGAITSEETYLTAQRPASLDLYLLPFLQGMLYVGMEDSLSNEEIQLVQSLADAFSTAYARYEDFNKLESAKKQIEKTLVNLKQAQSQLIQSEKMASLGELTAGIAHEIQNPLNFVNNFSEVNKEMIVEMKEEISKGNYDEAKIIADDIEANEEKINHHGKRADAIVKGMLQHSRSSTGQKEPTDINALADEFLRLAYHGLRAKDKSFNADIKTNFDDTIGKINIIPQDIGRVLLNVFNNAFYAVSERQKAEILKHNEQYTPLVSVQTKKINDKVEIKVTDNGNGIPENIVDKIFQPFFTTKPTGEGTGLGLSLAYDIIKAHGGELKVDTKEGEGSEFIIELLLNTAK